MERHSCQDHTATGEYSYTLRYGRRKDIKASEVTNNILSCVKLLRHVAL